MSIQNIGTKGIVKNTAQITKAWQGAGVECQEEIHK